MAGRCSGQTWRALSVQIGCGQSGESRNSHRNDHRRKRLRVERKQCAANSLCGQEFEIWQRLRAQRKGNAPPTTSVRREGEGLTGLALQ
eukprot:1153952-Pelagomonas_calceolata.AAC.1